ncbi:MAG: prephenate dehydrogenase/arogenate dehydrogenase family protein [Chloroflexota bacterium]|nr:prephenate dehydrogenase/arogenate dehydrogenase family protein [Chloroflexota bacterium]
MIGGSIALALRARGAVVRGVSRSETTIARALELGAVERASTDLRGEVPEAGLIILAAPVRTSIALLGEIGAQARPGTVVTDVCSSKREVVEAMDALPEALGAVGGHPMAGKETAGIGAAQPDLFRDTTWVLSESTRTNPAARAVCETLVGLCGANALWVGAGEHDQAVAAISHLPLLTAAALVLAAEASGSELVWQLASSGFRDSTRLAAGNERMEADLLLTNRAQVAAAQRRFSQQLEALLQACKAGDDSELCGLLAKAARRRRALYGGNQPA